MRYSFSRYIAQYVQWFHEHPTEACSRNERADGPLPFAALNSPIRELLT